MVTQSVPLEHSAVRNAAIHQGEPSEVDSYRKVLGFPPAAWRVFLASVR
jgi:hypothetical protein